MSVFYDLASLVLVPSGYKASKVYAQKPLTTDGQLTFSRASTATRVNASGLIETVASNVPRLDYLGSTCPKLQLEPQRTNLVTYSEQFDNAAWTKTQASVTANDAVSPDGYTNADKLIPNTTSNFHLVLQSIPDTAASWTYSVFAKSAGYDRLILWVASTNFVGFNLSTGVIESTLGINVTSANIQNYGNGWYRCSITSTSTASSTSVSIGVFNAAYTNGNVNPIFTGNGTDGILVYGAQFEAGAYATSYIPTTSAAVTRLADAASKTGVSGLLGATQGTIFMEVDFKYNNGSSDNTRMWSAWDSSNAQVISLWARDNALRYQFYNAVSGVNIEDVITATQGLHKVAMAYNGTNLKVYMDGALIVNTTMIASASLSLTAYGSGTFWVNPTQSHSTQLKQGLLFATALTSAQLAELTSL